MRIAQIKIKNFRGISAAHIYLDGHSVIIGDNNAGKSTVFEAIDLVLGPDRLRRVPVIDEHDFYNGKYYDPNGVSPIIEIELVIIDLEDSQKNRFKNNIEFWDCVFCEILPPNTIDKIDADETVSALRVKFIGKYNAEEDDFEGDTFFCWPENDNGNLPQFLKGDKRECGFLYLRALRTGARALSMERGSLLDIILRIRELRPKMWENVLDQLRNTDVATEPDLGIKSILTEVQEALKEFVPFDWGAEPILRVSDLTREHLRKTLTIFLSTGNGSYHAPFQHQGTGTINTMVLALLSMIAEAKRNVIFAMEEPEIAIPPYTQKRIIDSIRRKSTQAIFTSHSPFVLEEFSPHQIVLIQRCNKGIVKSSQVFFPSTIKPKSYSTEFRLKFAEALLAKRVLLTEGNTEAISYPAAGRKLNELDSKQYSSLEALGVAIFDAGSETSIESFGKYFKDLGKTVFAVFDKQTNESLQKMQKAIEHAFESQYKGFENLLISEVDKDIIVKFYNQLLENKEWPPHLDNLKPGNDAPIEDYKKAIKKFLIDKKGAHRAADLIGICEHVKQIPETVTNVIKSIKKILENPELELEEAQYEKV